MNTSPILSIITINLNNRVGLEKTIQSVIAQTSLDYEYIIIDGQSVDGSLEIIKQYKDQITYWVSEPNKGIYGNMNRGIKECRGKFYLFLNSGDWLVDGVLKSILPICHTDDIIYFNTYLSYDGKKFEELRYPASLTMMSFYKRTIGHQSTLISSELFVKYGLYNENNKLHSDYEFWIKTIVIGNCTARYEDTFLAFYDMGGRTSKPTKLGDDEIQSIQARYLPQRVVEDYSFWHDRERKLEILLWYSKQNLLHSTLIFLYKVIKNVNRLVSRN